MGHVKEITAIAKCAINGPIVLYKNGKRLGVEEYIKVFGIEGLCI
jgi:hypothetical protein